MDRSAFLSRIRLRGVAWHNKRTAGKTVENDDNGCVVLYMGLFATRREIQTTGGIIWS